MAIVSNGFWGTISLADNGGQVSVLQYQMQESSFALALSDIALIATALAALTNSKVSAYSCAERYVEDNLILPADGVQNEGKASLTVSLTGGIKKANLKIPAPVIDMFAGTEGGAANQVNTTYVPLLTYVNYFAPAAKAYISDGETVNSLLSGKRIHAKSNLG